MPKVQRKGVSKPFVVVGNTTTIVRKGVVVLDIDGTLVDLTGRIPIKKAVAMIREKSRAHPIVVITGRPESMKDTIAKELNSAGVKYDALVMRGVMNNVSDDVFKEQVIKYLGIRPIEVHGSSPTVLARLVKYPSRGSYYWYSGGYAYIPPLYAFVNGGKVWLHRTKEVFEATIRMKDTTVEYAGHTYRFRDGIHAMGFLLMQGDLLREHYCIPECVEVDYGEVITLADVLESIKYGEAPPQTDEVLITPDRLDLRSVEEYVIRNAEEIAYSVVSPGATVYTSVPTAEEFAQDTYADMLIARVKHLRGDIAVPNWLKPHFEKSLYDPTYMHNITTKNDLVFAVHRGSVIVHKTYDTTPPTLSDSAVSSPDTIRALRALLSQINQFHSTFDVIAEQFRKELRALGIKTVKKTYLLKIDVGKVTVGTIPQLDEATKTVNKII